MRWGAYAPRTARLSNRVHWFFVETEPARGAVGSEPGIDPRLVSPAELGRQFGSGEFVLQLHIGALLLAGLRGHLDLAAPGRGLTLRGKGLAPKTERGN